MEESEEEEEEDVEGEDGMKEDCLSDEPHNGECKGLFLILHYWLIINSSLFRGGRS